MEKYYRKEENQCKDMRRVCYVFLEYFKTKSWVPFSIFTITYFGGRSVCVCVTTLVEVMGQHSGVDSLHLPYGSHLVEHLYLMSPLAGPKNYFFAFMLFFETKSLADQAFLGT